MKEKLAKLIDVKSIITILITIAFIYLSISGAIGKDDFLPILLMVLTYYFSRTANNERNDENGKH